MDNKITKARLSSFMAYSWITLIIVAVAAILAWELLFAFGSVKLSREESFYYYYDINVSYDNFATFNNQLLTDNDGDQIFSYGIQKVEPTYLLENYEQFITLVKGIDGDAMFSSSKRNSKEGQDYTTSQVDSIIDGFLTYDYDKLVSDAKAYLSKYVEQGQDPLNFSNFSIEKMETEFLNRVKNDNRFRTKEQKREGFNSEMQRLEDLANATKRLSLLLEYDNTLPENDKVFYKYRRFEQSLNGASESEKAEYEEAYNNTTTLRYGLNLVKLTGGKYNTQDFFRLTNSNTTTSENTVLIIFDYYEEQPFFQFEAITFVDYIVSSFGSFSFYA